MRGNKSKTGKLEYYIPVIVAYPVGDAMSRGGLVRESPRGWHSRPWRFVECDTHAALGHTRQQVYSKQGGKTEKEGLGNGAVEVEKECRKLFGRWYQKIIDVRGLCNIQKKIGLTQSVNKRE